MSWLDFRHQAMATEFSITIANQEGEYARQAATAAWRELDRLETELSRFVETSDISRANRLAPGESITIGEDALRCLLLAAEMAIATQNAFNAAYASEHAADAPAFTLDPDTHTLTSQAQRLHLDLGAIGKGYALDRLADVLADWGITTACLQSGGSTALALDPPDDLIGWPIGVGDGASNRTLALTRAALSGSGIAVKGQHLIDPVKHVAATRANRVWALASTAALSDALSTAFFVMSDEEIAAFCDAHPEIGAAISRGPEQLSLHGALATYPTF